MTAQTIMIKELMEEVVPLLNESDSEFVGYFDDNGGEPDGNAWLPRIPIQPEDPRKLFATGLVEQVSAHFLTDDEIVEWTHGHDVLSLARDTDDPDAWHNHVEDWLVDHPESEPGWAWAHYGAYLAGDSIWVVARL